MLANDYTRCDGKIKGDGVEQECQRCQRRTSPRPLYRVWMMRPILGEACLSRITEVDDE